MITDPSAQRFDLPVVCALGDHGEFITAYAEYRTVLKGVAYYLAGVTEILVSRLMAGGIVDHLEVVDIQHHDSERILHVL